MEIQLGLVSTVQMAQPLRLFQSHPLAESAAVVPLAY
jgi:hypothetical protein